MDILKIIYRYILTGIFLFGWWCFYGFNFIALVEAIIPGSTDNGGKPEDINFYIWMLWYILILLSYSFFFMKYFKIFFINKGNIKEKNIVLAKCVGLIFILILTNIFCKIISIALGIAHIETAFWYQG